MFLVAAFEGGFEGGDVGGEGDYSLGERLDVGRVVAVLPGWSNAILGPEALEMMAVVVSKRRD